MRIKNSQGHPAGLYILFFTELWERFSFYGMRAIFVLFLVSSTTAENSGFGWTNKDAIALLGWYMMGVYVASIPGGYIADRILGQKKTVILGGWLLCIGHLILALHSTFTFYIGIIIIILGVGCLKPNISSMVGGLYKEGDKRRDVGFTIFYIGINIGAFIAPLLVGYVGEVYNWHYGFGLAGIGMFIGQMVFLWGRKYLKGVGESPKSVPDANRAKMKRPLTAIEKDRVKVMLLSFLLIIVFWGAYEQAAGLMNIYTFEKTNRMVGSFLIPASWFQSLSALIIIFFGFPIAFFWHQMAKKGKESSSLFKMGLGVIIMGWGYIFMVAAVNEYESVGSSAIYWLFLAYFFHVVGELCASPVALSFITKLAPLKYASIMMGLYFAATGIGNKVAGLIGEWSQSVGEKQIFIGLVVTCTLVGLIVLALLKPLKRLTHGAESLPDTHFEEAEGFELADQPKSDSGQ